MPAGWRASRRCCGTRRHWRRNCCRHSCERSRTAAPKGGLRPARRDRAQGEVAPMSAMRRSDVAELVLLAALWGAGFLFMRIGVAAFGPMALVFLRVAGASLLLVPLLLWRGEGTALRRHWKPIAVVGLFNSTL